MLTKYYKFEDFEEKKREFSLYPAPGESVKDATLDPEVLSFEQESIIQQFMEKKVTKKVDIENIVLTH